MPRKPATDRPKPPTEAEILASIKKWLDTMPGKVWYYRAQGGGVRRGNDFIAQKSGAPDLILCVNGFFVGLEVKAPKGKLTETQEKEFPKIERALGPVYVARSLEDAQRELEPYLSTSVVGIMP